MSFNYMRKKSVRKKSEKKISLSSDDETGLLIEANCSKTLEPNRTIPSRNGRSYAFKATF